MLFSNGLKLNNANSTWLKICLNWFLISKLPASRDLNFLTNFFFFFCNCFSTFFCPIIYSWIWSSWKISNSLLTILAVPNLNRNSAGAIGICFLFLFFVCVSLKKIHFLFVKENMKALQFLPKSIKGDTKWWKGHSEFLVKVLLA